eukprot:3940988-Rhodomonas_salina.1
MEALNHACGVLWVTSGTARLRTKRQYGPVKRQYWASAMCYAELCAYPGMAYGVLTDIRRMATAEQGERGRDAIAKDEEALDALWEVIADPSVEE